MTTLRFQKRKLQQKVVKKKSARMEKSDRFKDPKPLPLIQKRAIVKPARKRIMSATEVIAKLKSRNPEG